MAALTYRLISLLVVLQVPTLPANILDLSTWKLTLPLRSQPPGHATEVEASELTKYRHPDFFFVNSSGEGVVFRAPCGGVTTRGSKYPRSELREMTAEGKQRAAWSTDDPRLHTMQARLAITHLPANKPHVVCAQIHDEDADVLMIRLEGTRLLIERTGEKDVVIDRNYQLDTPFDLKITAGNRLVSVWYNGEQRLNWPVSRTGCYFKAGCYTQSNVARGDAPQDYGEVVYYSLTLAATSNP